MEVHLSPQILARTDRWVVVDKPAGWLTIPGRGHPEAPVLVDWLREREPTALVAHRLDIETSGVILFALTAESHREANRFFSEHRVVKFYDYLAAGRPLVPMFRVREPIDSSPATTQLEVQEVFPGAFLGRARPLSGKRHQIRIHLAHQGHPILGDLAYGGPRSMTLPNQTSALAIERVALHATCLELPGGERFEASWPADFSTWVKRLREASGRTLASVPTAGGN